MSDDDKPDPAPADRAPQPARREFLQRVGIVGAAAGLGLPPGKGATAGTDTAASRPPSTTTLPLTLRVNGRALQLQIDPRTTLLDALRERAGLTGTKKACDLGQCGACTVLVNGRRINSCLTLALMHEHDEVTTIEGLGAPGRLHPMQQAFLDHDGYQCGYCTPGQIMSAVALLKEPCGPRDEDVKEAMAGNICRCGAYNNIVAAIQKVRRS